jgi:hypothetical protein
MKEKAGDSTDRYCIEKISSENSPYFLALS